MLLTIIIPVYSVEKYIKRCLRSFIGQLYEDVELIIINDGTPDNSYEIAKKFAFLGNVRFLTQENSGLSYTRNRGIREAKGEYIWFVDSDDWISDGSISYILNNIQTRKDIYPLSYIEAYDNASLNKIITPNTCSSESLFQLFSNRFIFPAQFYIVKREFLIDNNLFFINNIYHEDVEYTSRLLLTAKSFSILTKPVYYFYKRPGSITQSYNRKRVDSYEIIIRSLIQKINLIPKEYSNVWADIIAMCCNNILYIMCMINSNNLIIKQTVNNISYSFDFIIKNTKNKRNKIEFILLKNFPKTTILIYCIYYSIKK